MLYTFFKYSSKFLFVQMVEGLCESFFLFKLLTCYLQLEKEMHAVFNLKLKFVQARFVRAEKYVKELDLSVGLMKKESEKLLQRAFLAEEEMKRGHANLK